VKFQKEAKYRKLQRQITNDPLLIDNIAVSTATYRINYTEAYSVRAARFAHSMITCSRMDFVIVLIS